MLERLLKSELLQDPDRRMGGPHIRTGAVARYVCTFRENRTVFSGVFGVGLWVMKSRQFGTGVMLGFVGKHTCAGSGPKNSSVRAASHAPCLNCCAVTAHFVWMGARFFVCCAVAPWFM